MGETAGFSIQAASSLISASSEGKAAEAAGDFRKNQAEENARLAELQASETEAKGQKDASQFRRKARGLQGAQRAALAAQGIDVDVGTAADLQAETAKHAEEDASQIRINAIRQAYGTRQEAINIQAQGDFDQIAGRTAKRNTLLAGGLSAAGLGARAFGASQKAKAPAKKGG